MHRRRRYASSESMSRCRMRRADGDAGVVDSGDGGCRKATALSFLSRARSGTMARREWSSIATWTNSHPVSSGSAVADDIACYAMASPVETAEFFDVDVLISPGESTLIARNGASASPCAESRLRPRRLRIRETLALEIDELKRDLFPGCSADGATLSTASATWLGGFGLAMKVSLEESITQVLHNVRTEALNSFESPSL